MTEQPAGPARPPRVAILGDEVPGYRKHSTIRPALELAAQARGTRLTVDWLGSERLGNAAELTRTLGDYDAFVAAPQSAEYCRSLDGVLRGLRYARERGRPLLGTCGGFQLMALEFARNALGLTGAEHPAFGGAAHPGPDALLRPAPCDLPAGRDEAGARPFRLSGSRGVRLIGHSRLATAYGRADTAEEFACSYVLGDRARTELTRGGLRTTAEGEAGDAAAIELDEHPFYVGVAFLPQWRSAPGAPHPLFVALVGAALGSAG